MTKIFSRTAHLAYPRQRMNNTATASTSIWTTIVVMEVRVTTKISVLLKPL